MATRTITDAGGIFSDAGTWVENAVPTSADDVVATATSGPLTTSSAAVSRSADLSLYTSTLTRNANWSIGHSTAGPNNVALILGPNMTDAGSSAFIWVGTNATPQTVTTNGKSTRLTSLNTATGTLKLLDDLTSVGSTTTFTNGTIDLNGHRFQQPTFSIASNSNTRVLAFGSGGILGVSGNLTAAGTVTNFSTTGSGTISLSATTATIATGGANFSGTANGVTLALGTGSYTITGAGVFGPITRTSATAAKTLTLPAGVTVTASAFTVNGAPGLQLSVVSSSAGSPATLSVASGTARFNHCFIKDLTCTGGPAFEAYDCIDGGGNTGITFKVPKSLAATGVG